MAYVAIHSDGTVVVIDTVTNVVAATIGVGVYPYGVAVSPDGGGVCVTNTGDDTVSVIDTATNTVTTTIPVGVYPYRVAVTPDGGSAYVTNGHQATVSVIDTAADAVTTTIPVGTSPRGVAVTPDGGNVYVTNAGDDTVSVIDAATNTVSATVPVGGNPFGVAVTPDGGSVYVANLDPGTVSVIDAATNTVTTTIPVGNYALDVAVTPDGGSVYVVNAGYDTVSVIDTATNTVTLTIPAGGHGPGGIAIGAGPTSAVAVTAEPNPAQVERPVTLKATVTCPEGTATGTVEFRDGAAVVGSAHLIQGAATLLRSFEAGPHTITALYSGDDNCPAAESPPITLTVNKGTSTTVASAQPRVTPPNRRVALLARVLCDGILPTGTIEFRDDTTTLGTIPLTAGFASLVTTFTTTGTHTITALYSGDEHCESSTSPPVTITVR
ncbi:Ig-like domain repeat protein [Actinomadura sp. K4S16]|uniref:Ig-like domain repeat protein n=1 Tax=Actinomadura sp. K4S16 TaxID=1316147 RepID=UPI00190F6CF1|nr:Ig-like domain repeat protein [Actinomadura sp. K4S16]